MHVTIPVSIMSCESEPTCANGKVVCQVEELIALTSWANVTSYSIDWVGGILLSPPLNKSHVGLLEM